MSDPVEPTSQSPLSGIPLLGIPSDQSLGWLKHENQVRRVEQSNRVLLRENGCLRTDLTTTRHELERTRAFLVDSLAELVGIKVPFTGLRSIRLKQFANVLCTEASRLPTFRDEITDEFVLLLETWIPLLDVGFLLMHDSFLLKPGQLTPDEREKMQAHTVLGAELLARIASRQPKQMAFYHMPISIARFHHERYDGMGYPDQLIGKEIPLAARITAICDVYDAMRSQRVYKPSMTHDVTIKSMFAENGHFDPDLMEVFTNATDEFESIFDSIQPR